MKPLRALSCFLRRDFIDWKINTSIINQIDFSLVPSHIFLSFPIETHKCFPIKSKCKEQWFFAVFFRIVEQRTKCTIFYYVEFSFFKTYSISQSDLGGRGGNRKIRYIFGVCLNEQMQSVCVCTDWIQCHNEKLFVLFVLYTRSCTTAGYIGETWNNRKATNTADKAAFHNSHHNEIYRNYIWRKIERDWNERQHFMCIFAKMVQFNYEKLLLLQVHRLIAFQRNVRR